MQILLTSWYESLAFYIGGCAFQTLCGWGWNPTRIWHGNRFARRPGSLAWASIQSCRGFGCYTRGGVRVQELWHFHIGAGASA